MIGTLYKPPAIQHIRSLAQRTQTKSTPLNAQPTEKPIKAPTLVQVTAKAIAPGGWLHQGWTASAAGKAAFPRQAAVVPAISQKLATAFTSIRNPSPAQVSGQPARPPEVPHKPEGLTALMRERMAARNAPPAQDRVPAVPSERKTDRPVAAPPPPPMPTVSAQTKASKPPLARGGSLDSATKTQRPTLPLARAQSEDSALAGRSNLLEAIRNHGGVGALKQKTVELTSVGTATAGGPAAKPSLAARDRVQAVGVNMLGHAADELRARLAARGQSPAIPERPKMEKAGSVASVSSSDSGKSSLSSSSESIPNSVKSADSWSYTPASQVKDTQAQMDLQRELQNKLFALTQKKALADPAA